MGRDCPRCYRQGWGWTVKVTLDKTHYRLIVRNADGDVLAARETNCNPAALRQILLDVRILGAQVDWQNSMVAKPSGGGK